MSTPNVIYIESFARELKEGSEVQINIDGRWHQARPVNLNGPLFRLRAAWLVFTGKADAAVWGGGQ